eukprot:3909004-Amphidinium_carterae.1
MGGSQRNSQSRRARQRSARQARRSAREDGDGTQQEEQMGKDALLERVQQLEKAQKLLGGQELDASLCELRGQLREASPLPKRMQALSQGVQRRQEKLGKWTAKQRDLRAQLEGLEPQMYKAIEQIRQDYGKKRLLLEQELAEAESSLEAAEEGLAELQEQQTKLLGQPSVGPKPGEDYLAFQRVAAVLSARVPHYGQVFEEMQKVAHEVGVPLELPARAQLQVQADRERLPGAGVYSTPPPSHLATPEDVPMEVEEGQKAAVRLREADTPVDKGQMLLSESWAKKARQTDEVQATMRERSTSRSPRERSG